MSILPSMTWEIFLKSQEPGTAAYTLRENPEDLLEVLDEAETRAKKLAESDEYGFIAAADANAENVVHSLYDNIVDGRKVVVEFK